MFERVLLQPFTVGYQVSAVFKLYFVLMYYNEIIYINNHGEFEWIWSWQKPVLILIFQWEGVR